MRVGRSSARPRRIAVNGAFRPQRTTGQQRYAAEIANRLVARGVHEIRPGRFWARSSLRTWVWTLTVLPFRARGKVLVSLTARAPIWHSRQVLAVHDLFVLTNPEWYSRQYIWSHVPLLRLQLRWSRAVVAVSQPVAEELAASNTAGGPITLAPNAPSDIFVDAEQADGVLQKLGLAHDRFLLAIGSQDPRKNLARLSEAWRRVPAERRAATPLVIVGGGDGIYRQGDVEWPDGTVITGYVSDAELVSLYEAAKAVVLVSLAEGFGLPIIEAAAAGVRRFLLSDIEVFHWIAGEAASYVDPRSVDAIAEGLDSVAQRTGPPAPAIDVTRFEWNRSADAVRAAADEVARQ